jgi:hypothetical protein
MQKLVVLETLGGGLGDEICSEPVVRYACKYLYPTDDVRICTRYPQVFKHLNKPCGKDNKELGILPWMQFLHLSASPYKIINGEHHTHPFAKIAQPLFIHTLDFHSLFMIGRILPNEARRVFLQVTEQSRKNISTLPESFIAFHIGSSGEDKRLSDNYCQTIIDGLKLPVVVFGTTNHDLKNVIDLTNKLAVDDMFALIEKACILITNDSAPLHAAAAFDNHIILIPSVKHPDRLLHTRYGMQYWKAHAPYKKLMVDDRSYPPDKPIQGWEWYPKIENQEDYYPEPITIINIARSCWYDIHRKV